MSGPSLLPPLPIQYSDFSQWQRQTFDTATSLQYWSAELQGLPVPTVLPHLERPVRQHGRAEAGMLFVYLSCLGEVQS